MDTELELITAKEAAKIMGVSEQMVYRFARRKILPHYRYNEKGKVVFRRREINEFIASRWVEAQTP